MRFIWVSTVYTSGLAWAMMTISSFLISTGEWEVLEMTPPLSSAFSFVFLLYLSSCTAISSCGRVNLFTASVRRPMHRTATWHWKTWRTLGTVVHPLPEGQTYPHFQGGFVLTSSSTRWVSISCRPLNIGNLKIKLITHSERLIQRECTEREFLKKLFNLGQDTKALKHSAHASVFPLTKKGACAMFLVMLLISNHYTQQACTQILLFCNNRLPSLWTILLICLLFHNKWLLQGLLLTLWMHRPYIYGHIKLLVVVATILYICIYSWQVHLLFAQS